MEQKLALKEAWSARKDPDDPYKDLRAQLIHNLLAGSSYEVSVCVVACLSRSPCSSISLRITASGVRLASGFMAEIKFGASFLIVFAWIRCFCVCAVDSWSDQQGLCGFV